MPNFHAYAHWLLYDHWLIGKTCHLGVVCATHILGNGQFPSDISLYPARLGLELGVGLVGLG